MTQTTGQSSNLPVTALLITALTAGGVFMLQEPLTSLRHKEQAQTFGTETVDENVDARLWQDPLQVVQADWARLVDHLTEEDELPPSAIVPKTIFEMRADLATDESGKSEGTEKLKGKNLLISVMMPSSPYADDAEHRRRQRYALVSALSDSEYSPEHADRIGYFIAPGMQETESERDLEEVCRSPKDGKWQCPVAQSPLIIAYESFKPGKEVSNDGWSRIFVLWVARRALGENLLPKIRSMSHYLVGSDSGEWVSVLLGPDDSGGLIDMYNLSGDANEIEAEYRRRSDAYPSDAREVLLDRRISHDVSGTVPRAEPDKVSAPPTGDEATGEIPGSLDLHIISPRSTVPLQVLFPGEQFEGLSPEEGDRKIADRLEVKSFSTILARDDAVIEGIIREFVSRGLDDCRSASGIAIVTEADSAYGRALPKVVERAIEATMGCQTHVHSFGYLKGVDGELPPKAIPASSRASAGGALASSSKAKDFELSLISGMPELAVGVAQTDYIRRLAERIAQQHVELSAHDHGGFRAIGILGTDVYDKQLILHALRARLPAVTFFTTDLDARLNAPREYRWTRNLVIGSAYGLVPHQSGYDVTPLRDSYQTAFFLSTKLALQVGLVEHSPQLFVEQARPFPPRLFEIGRSGAIDITVCDSECRNQSRAFGRVGWRRHSGGIGSVMARTLALLTPLIALVLVSLAAIRGLARKNSEFLFRAHKIVFITSLASAIALGTILWSWDSNAFEPWLLTVGISSVPTLILHITSLIYSFCFVTIVWGRVAQSNTDCSEHFFHLTRYQEMALSVWCKALNPFGRNVLLGKWTRDISEAKAKEVEIDPFQIWKTYRWLGMPWPRIFRVLPSTVFWTLVIWIVLSHDANPLLARNLQGWLDFIRMLTVFMVLGVIFTCVDALKLGQLFIRSLVFHRLTRWKYRKKSRKKLDDTVARLWRKMELIVTHTELLSPLIVLPFVLLFLLILARMTLFDGWVWTPNLVAIYLGFSVHLLIRAWLFQREAAHARDRIISQLEQRRIILAADKVALRRIDFVLNEIYSIRHGAFVPWTRHPLVQSILLPAIGVVMLTLLGLLT